jgi:protein gp37
MVHRFTKYESYGMEPKTLEKPYCRQGVADDDYYKDPYPYGFAPTFHRYRLNDYKDKRGRIIFVGSMCDLFGDWVPDSWIEEVFKACEAAPQHKYLFLTKNPDLYAGAWLQDKIFDRKLHENAYFGATATSQDMAHKAIECFGETRTPIKTFLSIEPILEKMRIPIINWVNWVIVGAETGRRKDKVIPERLWIERIMSQCRSANIPLFMKESLRELMGDDFIQEWPKELKNQD